MHPDPKTLEALNTPKAFQEYPKAMFHPDGSYREVQSQAEEEALPIEWQPTLDLALKQAKAQPTTHDDDPGKAKSKAK